MNQWQVGSDSGVTQNGQVRYELKTPYRDGTTHVVFSPLDFIARLVALIPKPRVNLARYHCVFAPNSRWRDQVTPGDKGNKSDIQTEEEEGERFVLRMGVWVGVNIFCMVSTWFKSVSYTHLTLPTKRIV